MKKSKFLTVGVLALLLTFSFVLAGCDDAADNPGDDPGRGGAGELSPGGGTPGGQGTPGTTNTAVTFSSVTANGSTTETTTQLTLTFSQAISGLTANDITLSGITGVVKGTLSGSGPAYTLPISGFTAGGTLSVAVTKTGFTISGSPQTTTVFATTETPNPGAAPGSSRETAIHLTATNTWVRGTISAGQSQVWYKFNVTVPLADMLTILDRESGPVTTDRNITHTADITARLLNPNGVSLQASWGTNFGPTNQTTFSFNNQPTGEWFLIIEVRNATYGTFGIMF